MWRVRSMGYGLHPQKFKKHGKISVITARNHFVTWNKAIEKAGLVPIDGILKVSTNKI